MGALMTDLEQAITLLKAAGYRVSKPRQKQTPIGLNAVGKPYGANFDPSYKLRTPLTSIKRLYAPFGNGIRWV
jgi:hypothetical protein